ncbi:MAG: hypothetical protein LCH54_10255 [Bacteroidetes bacterium]|nr:hypothetical protein [Bacteroidota bacterium]
MSNEITVFILDDNIYKSSDFVEKSVYNTKIDSISLLHLVDSFEWKGQHSLQSLTKNILKSNHSKNESIATYGFTHPAICLDAIEGGLIPDVIIYDWEYEGENSTKSSNWLKEILVTVPNSFVFVYSNVRDEIPSFLNKMEFDEYAQRFQLFLKGDDKNTIFTSEEFILQYIFSRVSKNNEIKIQGLSVTFYENGYLKSPGDILYLEKIFGRASLIEKLKMQNYFISEQTIENIVASAPGKIFVDEKRNYLITPDSTLLVEKFKPNIEISYLDVLKKYGLKVLNEVLETGLKKI